MFKEKANSEPACAGMPEEEIDEALEETFPASDPPPWTTGVENHCRDRKEASLNSPTKDDSEKG